MKPHWMYYYRHKLPGEERVDGSWIPTYMWIAFVFVIFMAFC